MTSVKTLRCRQLQKYSIHLDALFVRPDVPAEQMSTARRNRALLTLSILAYCRHVGPLEEEWEGPGDAGTDWEARWESHVRSLPAMLSHISRWMAEDGWKEEEEQQSAWPQQAGAQAATLWESEFQSPSSSDRELQMEARNPPTESRAVPEPAFGAAEHTMPSPSIGQAAHPVVSAPGLNQHASAGVTYHPAVLNNSPSNHDGISVISEKPPMLQSGIQSLHPPSPATLTTAAISPGDHQDRVPSRIFPSAPGTSRCTKADPLAHSRKEYRVGLDAISNSVDHSDLSQKKSTHTELVILGAATGSAAQASNDDSKWAQYRARRVAELERVRPGQKKQKQHTLASQTQRLSICEDRAAPLGHGRSPIAPDATLRSDNRMPGLSWQDKGKEKDSQHQPGQAQVVDSCSAGMPAGDSGTETGTETVVCDEEQKLFLRFYLEKRLEDSFRSSMSG